MYIRRWITATCGGDVATVKIYRTKALLIETKSTDQNKAPFAAQSFKGSVEAAEHLNAVEGLIYCPDLKDMTEESILNDLEPQGVIEVLRLAPKKGTTSANPVVKLKFAGHELPARIFCRYMTVKVKPWVPGPKQCRNCFAFGHLTDTVGT